MKTGSGTGGGPPTEHVGAPDLQAKEKLAIYVYEYLVHTGANQAAAAFLEEKWRDKTIRISNAPGFLQAWWSVFWDLYSAAPEHRQDLPCSSEARAMYDYGLVQSGMIVNPPPGQPMPMPGPDGMPMQPHPAFFAGSHMPPRGPAPPHQQLMPRYPSMRPSMPRPVPHEPPFSSHQPMFSPNDGMPPQGMMHHGGPPPGHFPMSMQRMQMLGGQQHPPQDTFRPWPSTSLSPSMANGPPPASTTPIMPSPSAQPTALPPRSVGTPGPGSVPNSQGGGGPQDPGPDTGASDYSENPREEDAEEIMRIKKSIGEAARCFEAGDPGNGPGPGDYSFMS